jgi:hypothetical protein
VFLTVARTSSAVPAADLAVVWLARAARAVGLDTTGATVLRVTRAITRELDDQSDRAYPPFLVAVEQDTLWLDPATGIELVAPGGGSRVLRAATGTFRRQPDSTFAPDAQAHSRLWSDRALDPWAVLAEWRRDGHVRVEGPRTFRDYPRVVLARRGALGTERLLLDARTAIPVALERTEPHYFLGATRVAYLYQTWQGVDGRALYPYAVSRLVNGRQAWSATLIAPGAGAAILTRGEAPSLALRDTTVMALNPGRRFADAEVDTVAAGPDTWLLVSPTFTSVVTRQADTVYLLDATAGDERARRDAAWVDRLFPRRRAIVVVALNPVWPHVAGLRYWVGRGATVVTPRAGAPFLRRHLAPGDGRAVAMRVTGDSLTLGGGALRLYGMEGLNGEGVDLAWVAPAGLVWATDHIQDVSRPNIYLEDVRRTVERHRLAPRWTSGPHLRLVPWTTIQALPRISAGSFDSP